MHRPVYYVVLVQKAVYALKNRRPRDPQFSFRDSGLNIEQSNSLASLHRMTSEQPNPRGCVLAPEPPSPLSLKASVVALLSLAGQPTNFLLYLGHQAAALQVTVREVEA